MVTQLSLFLPAFNEEKNLPLLIKDCDQFLKNNLSQYEMIVIGDGSSGGTKKVVEDLTSKYKHLRLVSHSANLGYGQALRSGIQAARYPWAFFMDSDNQFKIQDLKPFLAYSDFDLVIGSRLKRNDPARRLLASWVYGLFVKTLFGLKIRDIDCAFKMMKKKSVENLGFVSNSFFASTELLVLAKKKGLSIKEIGVHHYPRKAGVSTVTFNRVLRSLLELKKLYFKQAKV